MNYNHLLSGGHGENADNMGSQGSLKQGQKRGHDQQLGDGPHVVVRRRLAADTTSILTPWPHTSTSNPLFHPGHFDHLGRPISLRAPIMMVDSEYPNGHNGNVELGGAAAQLPLLNLPSAGIPPLLRYSTNGLLLDSIFNKEEMYPNCGAYNHPSHVISAGENGFVDSDISRQLFLGYSGNNEVENMRQALGKDVNRSPAETACQNAGSKFTLMGEPVEKSTGTDSSDPLQKMPTLAPHFGSRPRGLFALGPYLSHADYNCMTTGYAADLANLNSDKVPAPPGSNPISYPNSIQSRRLYRGSLADRCGSSSNSSIPFGLSQGSFSHICGNSTIMNDPSATFHASVGLKMGRHTGPGNLLSFEASNFAIQEYLRNTGKSPAEPGTSKIAFKSGTVRRKDKDNSNIFPANVKSLLSTGIFDGVPVKYVSWDRSKNVRGTIQGTGYLCWCENCNKTKTANAYQLEQHAGSKSKHPNDHIYFSNGKSIYGVVQELKNTPSDKLLEVIPTVTGSGINEANFSKWKESFQAAGRELHRIFGSESAETPSQDVGLLAAREQGRPDGHPPAE